MGLKSETQPRKRMNRTKNVANLFWFFFSYFVRYEMQDVILHANNLQRRLFYLFICLKRFKLQWKQPKKTDLKKKNIYIYNCKQFCILSQNIWLTHLLYLRDTVSRQQIFFVSHQFIIIFGTFSVCLFCQMKFFFPWFISFMNFTYCMSVCVCVCVCSSSDEAIWTFKNMCCNISIITTKKNTKNNWITVCSEWVKKKINKQKKHIHQVV